MKSSIKHNNREINKVIKAIALLLGFISLTACSEDSDDYRQVYLDQSPSLVPLDSLVLAAPKSCPDLKQYLVNSKIKNFTQLPFSVSCGTPKNGTYGVASSVERPSTPENVSDTNNQVLGVNEADIVKTDDNGILYIANGKYLIISKGFPAQGLNVLNKLNLGGQVTNLHLDKANQRLVVLSQFKNPIIIKGLEDNTPVSDKIIPAAQRSNSTDVIFLDISTPSNPMVLKQIRLDGSVLTSRRIKTRIHLILSSYDTTDTLLKLKGWELSNNFYNTVKDVVCASNETDPDVISKHVKVVDVKNAISAQVRKAYESVSVQDLIPKAKLSDGLGALTETSYLACTDIQHPKIYTNLNLNTISSIDTDGLNLKATALINTAKQTYVSKNSIYLTNQNRYWHSAGVSQTASQTAIHKFSIINQNTSYTATGTVDGYILNQFSLSEYKGDLRLATTQNDSFRIPNSEGDVIVNSERTNNLFVLRDNGNRTLDVIGQVRGFGKTETIRSSRFINDRAYVVTFRRVDPLFTFDLSIPESPILKGELTIPGFSRYMHAFDKDHLITIGRSGDSQLQLQLFNVSNLNNPKLLYAYVPKLQQQRSSSLAEYDHKAFTFYKPSNLLSIPVRYTDINTYKSFSGFYLFNISLDNGFTLAGTIDHSDLAYDKYCNPALSTRTSFEYDCLKGNYTNMSTARRSVLMSSNTDLFLFSLSDVGLKAVNVLDVSTILGSITFPTNAYPYRRY